MQPGISLAMYWAAGKVLEGVEKKRGSLKSLAFSLPGGNGKKIYALAAETLKRYEVIGRTVAASRILEENSSKGRVQVDRHQLYVAVYDLLYGRKKVKGREKVAVVVRKHAKVLWRCFSELQSSEELGKSLGEGTTHTTNCVLLVRYVRVNTLKASMEEVVENLSSIGFKEVQPDVFWDVLEVLKRGSHSGHPSYHHHHQWFTRDYHVPNLLVFSVHAKLQETDLYEQGHLILQDKASCLPALALSPSHDSHVIDACAAPGNKTTHLAAIMENCGSIEAFDIDASRCATLQRMVSKAGASCVRVHTEDFLKVDPQDYPNVTDILVDPSCSGSGIVRRMDHPQHLTRGLDKKRLRMLFAFQLRILLHALSFPSVNRVVYSTCSVHCEENEDVVKKALQVTETKFHLVCAMPEWPTRGLPVFPSALHCLRASPAQDHTNGFFVALFGRRSNNNILDNQALLRCPSQGELLTSSRRTPASHMEPHPLLRDTPSSSGTTPSTQGATTTPACGHRLASARQRLGRRTNHRHYKRVRCYMQLVFSRRFRQRQFQHCRGLYRPSYVLYPKYRCYY